MPTARTYDFILTVASATGFVSGNSIYGATSDTVAVIANVDLAANKLKVKVDNTFKEFSAGETIKDDAITLTTSANGAINSTSVPFQSNAFSGNTTVASTTISSIANSPFVAAKNAFTQNPIVRLYSLYYPGEWYPPNPNGNPTGAGAGRAWPVDVPFRFAEIVGDLQSDAVYRVKYGDVEYIPYPVDFTGLETGSDGKINEVSLSISNFDNIISTFVENPFLAGNNKSNSVQAIVNDELVHGIDPRTVNANPSDFGSEGNEGFDSLTRARANGLNYSATVQARYGTANASWTYNESIATGGTNPTDTWQEQKQDTRDLLGGVIEVKTTFANFLNFWPEYSSLRYKTANVIEVLSALPYRVGDKVVGQFGTTQATITAIEENKFLFLSNTLDSNTTIGDNIYIVNDDADEEAYVEDVFKIDNLEKLDENVATFGLVSWLQYFKLQVPKRKYYKNTCQWVYKGEECQYPGPSGGNIPGTSNPVLQANTVAITAANESAGANFDLDVCGKSILSCQLRNNQIHFGAFPATGRTVPKQ